MAVQKELTLEAGGDIGVGMVSTFAFRGRVPVSGQLKRAERVHVVVTDEDGEIVFASYGEVTGVGFKTHDKRDFRFTERAHTIRLTEAED